MQGKGPERVTRTAKASSSRLARKRSSKQRSVNRIAAFCLEVVRILLVKMEASVRVTRFSGSIVFNI